MSEMCFQVYLHVYAVIFFYIQMHYKKTHRVFAMYFSMNSEIIKTVLDLYERICQIACNEDNVTTRPMR